MADDQGKLYAQTFERLDEFQREPIDARCLAPLGDLPDPDRAPLCDAAGLRLVSRGRFQAFVFEPSLECFQFRARLKLITEGKCGLMFRIDPQTHDGYYLSLDLLKGVAQLRAWGTDKSRVGEHMMKFASLQEGYWRVETPGEAEVKLLAFGSYLELSVDGRVLLSLADQTFSIGRLGVYVESAEMLMRHPEIHRLESPTQTDEHLTQGWKMI